MCLGGSLDGLDSRLDPLGAIRRGAQTGILGFTMKIFDYEWLSLVIWIDEVKPSTDLE